MRTHEFMIHADFHRDELEALEYMLNVLEKGAA